MVWRQMRFQIHDPFQSAPVARHHNGGCAGDFVVASHTGLPDPWVEAPMAPLDIEDVWLGNALTVHRGGICPSPNPNPHRPRVFGFISVGTSRFDYNNTCPVVVPPWASKAAASPEGSQGPHATCGAVGCEVLLDVTDATTVFCVTRGNVPYCVPPTPWRGSVVHVRRALGIRVRQ